MAPDSFGCFTMIPRKFVRVQHNINIPRRIGIIEVKVGTVVGNSKSFNSSFRHQVNQGFNGNIIRAAKGSSGMNVAIAVEIHNNLFLLGNVKIKYQNACLSAGKITNKIQIGLQKEGVRLFFHDP